jgi:hypothetical protein
METAGKVHALYIYIYLYFTQTWVAQNNLETELTLDIHLIHLTKAKCFTQNIATVSVKVNKLKISGG